MSLVGKILVNENISLDNLKEANNKEYNYKEDKQIKEQNKTIFLNKLKKGLATGLTGLILYASSLGILGLTGCSSGVNGIVLPEQPEISQEELQQHLYFEGTLGIKQSYDVIYPYFNDMVDFFRKQGNNDPVTFSYQMIKESLFQSETSTTFVSPNTKIKEKQVPVFLSKTNTKWDEFFLDYFCNKVIPTINSTIKETGYTLIPVETYNNKGILINFPRDEFYWDPLHLFHDYPLMLIDLSECNFTYYYKKVTLHVRHPEDYKQFIKENSSIYHFNDANDQTIEEFMKKSYLIGFYQDIPQSLFEGRNIKSYDNSILSMHIKKNYSIWQTIFDFKYDQIARDVINIALLLPAGVDLEQIQNFIKKYY